MTPPCGTKTPPRTGLRAVRHLYTSLLIRHGESVKTEQRSLGHFSAAVPPDTYTRLWPDSEDRMREAVELALLPAADIVQKDGRSS